MKSLTLALITALGLSCSYMPSKPIYTNKNIEPDSLFNKIERWYSNPSYNGIVGESNMVNIEIKDLENYYSCPHLVLYYDLNNDGKEDLRAFFRINNPGEILIHPTIIACDINGDGKEDMVWIDVNNDGIKDFEK